MDSKEFREKAHSFVDWMTNYLENIEKYPVKSQVEPGQIYQQLPAGPPASGQPLDDIFADFENIIMPGITHWQSPNFFAYFPANSSYPSVLAEMLTATLGAQCMKWETSPAAAELEEMMMSWLKQMTGIPEDFHGVIQDTASTATLVALLTAREKMSDYQVNENGFVDQKKMRVYASEETHSSIEKAVKIAGLGRQNLVKIAVNEDYAMDLNALEKAIQEDIDSGYQPLCIIATLGTTGSTAIDPLAPIADIAKKHRTWLHVDAAFAGTALLLEDYRWMIEGIEHIDSFVFNPHKWMFTNFDCSAYFVKDKTALLNTLQIVPEYLRTGQQGKVNDYCDWGIPLGRRFRALKLWFVIRSYGVDGLREKISYHIYLANKLANKVMISDDFELLAPVSLNLVCFRYHPQGIDSKDKLNEINEDLLNRINQTGKIYLTHTKLKGKYTLRMVTANTHLELHHIEYAWKIITQAANRMPR
jgi:aromatic-L-amino-acid decarboxylase